MSKRENLKEQITGNRLQIFFAEKRTFLCNFVAEKRTFLCNFVAEKRTF